MVNLKEITQAFDVSNVSEAYRGSVEITDLKEELGTKGHVLVVRGDKAYFDILEDNAHLANPKFWLYEHLINSPGVQEQLRDHPNHKLFDGVGFSSLEALGYHAKRLGRKAVVVMANELIPEPEFYNRFPGVEVIHADIDKDGSLEEGYVNKQREVLHSRDDLIPLHQALYGAQGLAPIGNTVVNKLEELCIVPDETFWCVAAGANLYGIGSKVKEKFGSRTLVVEPSSNITIPDNLDLSNSDMVREFAEEQLKDYRMHDCSRRYSGIFPLHGEHINRYLLINWKQSGRTGIDEKLNIPVQKVTKIQNMLREVNPNYDWTKTTALTLTPAIESAKEGKNVLVMAYGRNRETPNRNLIINDSENFRIPWLLRWSTPAQKVAASIALAGYLTVVSYASYGIIFGDTPIFNGFAVVDKDGKTWVSRLADVNKER